jgi:hypothetical protein
MSDEIDSIFDDVVKLMRSYAERRKSDADVSLSRGLYECSPALIQALAMAIVLGCKGDKDKISDDVEATSGDLYRLATDPSLIEQGLRLSRNDG